MSASYTVMYYIIWALIVPWSKLGKTLVPVIALFKTNQFCANLQYSNVPKSFRRVLRVLLNVIQFVKFILLNFTLPVDDLGLIGNRIFADKNMTGFIQKGATRLAWLKFSLSLCCSCDVFIFDRSWSCDPGSWARQPGQYSSAKWSSAAYQEY